MLERTYTETAATRQEPERIKVIPRPIDHRKAKRFAVANPTFGALAAYQVHAGELTLSHLPVRQAAHLFGVPERDLLLIKRATPLELAALKNGRFTIEALRAQHHPRPSRKAIQKFIVRAGPIDVLNELDRMTAPQPAAE